MGKGPVSKQTRGLPPLVRALAFGCILLALLLCTQEVLAPKGGCIDGFYAEPEDTSFWAAAMPTRRLRPRRCGASRVSRGMYCTPGASRCG